MTKEKESLGGGGAGEWRNLKPQGSMQEEKQI